MLHQCDHQSTRAYPCSCGFLYGGGGAVADTFSFLFPVAEKPSRDEAFDGGNVYVSSFSSSVDCTLSLGTPSTRQTEKASSPQNQRRSCMSSLYWDMLSRSKNGSTNGGSTGTRSSLGGGPVLLARRCANCDTTSTPLWRNGPRGPKSLCNACGIRYKKEERRAAASTISPFSSSASGDQGVGYGYHRTQSSSWVCYSTRSNASISMYEDMTDGGDAPFLTWRLNVVPPTSQFRLRDPQSIYQIN